MVKPKPDKRSQWELEGSFDTIADISELVNAPPFREASDDLGQSQTVGTRIPNWLYRRVVKLREMGGAPYELNSDVLRDALWLGLKVLHVRYKASPDFAIEKKLAEIVDASGMARRIKENFQELEAALLEMYRDGDEAQAAERLTEYVMAATELTNDWHREKIFRLLVGSFPVKQIVTRCGEPVQRMLASPEEFKRLPGGGR